jgi:hypothetical protein
VRAPSIKQIAALAPVLALAHAAHGAEVRDPFFGEALFYAHQGLWFEALERLDTELAQHYRVDEPELDSLFPYIEDAEFSVGDFELSYRMHLRAGRAIRAVLAARVDEEVRNDASFRLARLHFEKGQPEDALRALEAIHGRIPESIRHDIGFLRANVYMALGRPAEAVEVLRDLQSARDLEGFSEYNLGIALLQDGREQEALAQLDRAGRIDADDPGTRAIRDKSNLVLGTILSEAARFDLAQRSLDRVHLAGPFSNQALLRAGWADASAENFERALVPWSILAKRDSTDAAVQEVLLALPYAYSKLDVHGRAAVLYERAAQTFSDELGKVDASIASIAKGEFLDALVREEIRRDRDWVIRLRSLPDAPETFYLLSLMASHDFQTALQNYLDLEDLRKKLVSWQQSLDAFEDVIALRRRYYEPILPAIDAQFRELDARMRLRLEQRKHLADRLDQLLVAPRPDQLATTGERLAVERLDRLRAALAGADRADADALRLRMRRLEGVLTWSLFTNYHQRLTDAHVHLRELDADIEELNERYEAFVRARQAATHSYEGYDTKIAGLRRRVRDSLQELDVLMARQGHMLEAVATDELRARRERLLVYQNQARFAFADSYDRALKAQAQ